MLPLKCQECGRTFTYPHQLRGHRRVHTMMNKTRYRCKVCNMTFSYLSGLRQHLASHFNHTSGDNQYMDDLAIGVTIEPVQESACHKSGAHSHRDQVVGPSCSEQELIFNRVQSGLEYSEYCSVHHMSSCCCESWPTARCGSVMLIDPRHVVHVDMTHDPSLSYPASEFAWSGGMVPGSVGPGRMVPECMGPGSMGPGSMGRGSMVRRSMVRGRVVPGIAVPGSAISMEDQGLFGHTFREEHMEEDAADEHDADDDSDVGWIFPPEGRDDKSNPHQESCRDIAAADGSVRPALSPDDGFLVNDVRLPVSSEVVDSTPQPQCGQGVAVVDEISGFDDVATCNDLSNFFPDFNEKSEAKTNSDSKARNSSDNRNSLVDEDDVLHSLAPNLHSICPTTPRGVGHRTDLLSSDLEACVKFGLDSKALNPTVVVNDLRREIARLQRAVGGEGKEGDAFTCDLCDVGFNNNKLLLKHVRLHRRALGKGKRNTVESENWNLDSGNGQRSKSKNKLKDDPLLKYVEKVGKTFTNRKPRPKFRVTVSKLNIKCYICGRVYTTKSHFVAHAKRHLKKLGYSQDFFYCTICYAFYPCENKLREHLVDIHANEEVTDEQCQVSLDAHKHSSQTNFIRKRKHSPQTSATANSTGLEANMTDSDFAESTTDQLVFPEFESDAEVGKWPDVGSTDQCRDTWCGICHVCGMPFSSKTGLSQHIVTCHEPRQARRRRRKRPTGKKIGFKCHICERIFASVQILKQHFISHDPRRTRLICPLTNCNSNYVWKQNFKRHLLSHATPKGQKFPQITFNLHNEVFCPFCTRLMFFISLDEYKMHMLIHVDKIMADECARNDISHKSKLVHSKKVIVVHRPEAQKRSELSSMKRTHEHCVSQSLATATLPSKDEVRKHPLPVVQSSTPNSCFGFADAVTNDVCSGDVSPGGSLQGNSGLFISPVWADVETQSTGAPAQPPSRQGRPGDCPTGQLSTDLNDSGFTQMLSGDSDHGELSREVTPQQGLPSFSFFSRNTRDRRHTAQTTAVDGNLQLRAPNTDSIYHSRKEDRPAYSLKEHRPAYSYKEDRAPYGLKEDRTAYGLNGNRDSYSTAVDSCSYLSSDSRYCYVSNGYFPKIRGSGSTFLTRERAVQLMSSSCATTANFKSKGLLCSICEQVKLDAENVKTHILSHFDACGKFAFKRQGKKFVCPLCFKIMLDRRSMTSHLFTHWGEHLIKCPVCYKIFNLVKTLNIHVVKVHPEYRYN